MNQQMEIARLRLDIFETILRNGGRPEAAIAQAERVYEAFYLGKILTPAPEQAGSPVAVLPLTHLPSQYQLGEIVSLRAEVVGVEFYPGKVHYALEFANGDVAEHDSINVEPRERTNIGPRAEPEPVARAVHP